LITKATKIAYKRNTEIGEEGWFTILEFLGNYMINVGEKANQSGIKVDKIGVDRLKDFVNQRKNAVLK
jgi:hypothetical protein